MIHTVKFQFYSYIILYQEEFTFNNIILIAKPIFFEMVGVQMCERQGHDLFYLDNTRQVRGVLQGHTKRGGIVVEQIGRYSSSYYSKRGGG